MRTLILAVATLATAATLTACGQATEHTAADKPTHRDVPSAASVDEGSEFTEDETAFLDSLEIVYPDLATAPMVRREAVNAGHATCDALDRGVTVEGLIQTYVATDVDQELAGGVLLAAVTELCPEYTADLDATIDGGDVA